MRGTFFSGGAWIFGFLTLVLGAVAVYLFVDAWRFAATAGHAEGVVTNVVWGYGNRRPAAYPVIRFEAPGGPVEFQARSGSSAPTYKVGDKVAVLYRPEDPRDARVDSFFDLYLGAAILGFIALVFGCVTAMVYFFVRDLLGYAVSQIPRG